MTLGTSLGISPEKDKVLLYGCEKYGLRYDSLVMQYFESPPTHQEILLCSLSKSYFINTYVHIYDSVEKNWVPFLLWESQEYALEEMQTHQAVVWIKSRQIGATWLALADALHEMLFRPIAVVLLFSRRDDEAVFLLDDRLKGMYSRLPDFLKAGAIVEDNSHSMKLSNESEVKAFSTTGGDTYTATYAIVDEAALIGKKLKSLINSVKPTIDMGGRILVLSRPNKDEPTSYFNAMYKGALGGRTVWHPLFLSWRANPNRSDEWYEKERESILEETGALDDLFERYPSTDEEALRASTKSKRLKDDWVKQCFVKNAPKYEDDHAPAIPDLILYEIPMPGELYSLGADPAEGNPTSDDSAFTIVNRKNDKEVASLSGKFDVDTFSQYIAEVGDYFNNAEIWVERNNHGQAILLGLRMILDDGKYYYDIADGIDERPGWLSSTKGKVLLYSYAASVIKQRHCVIRTEKTKDQLISIEGKTLRAPEGDNEDLADSFALALLHGYIRAPELFTDSW